MTHRILIAAIALWLSAGWPSLTEAKQDKLTPVYTPTGPSARDIVEAGIANLNADKTFKLRAPDDRSTVHHLYCQGYVSKTHQNKQVRWQGKVLENTDKKSKAIIVLVGNFQATGQTFTTSVWVTPKKGSEPPAVGTDVWVQGVVGKGAGWVYVRRVDRENITIHLPSPLTNACSFRDFVHHPRRGG